MPSIDGDKQGPVRRGHVQGMLDETDPLSEPFFHIGSKHFIQQPAKRVHFFLLTR